MSLGFIVRYSAVEAATALTQPRFAAKGARDRRSRMLGHGSLESTVVGEAAEHRQDLFFCGQLANWTEIAQRLVSQGLSREGFISPAHCIRLLYQQYGPPGLRMLEGLFVGAFIEGGKLVAFASKTPGPSLYYYLDSAAGTACVTTELKALPASERRLRAFTDIIDQAGAPTEQTCLHGVRRVQAGRCVDIQLDSQLLVEQDIEYYSTHRAITVFDEAQAIEQLREALSQAVFSSPGATAHCLVSGGLDSSIVAYLARRHFDGLTLFSLGTEKNNEFDKADAFGTSISLPVRRLVIEEDEFLNVLPEVIALIEHCFSTFAEYLIPVHLAHKQIGDSADILLSGYGSDVLFAGFAKPDHTLRQVTKLVESEYSSTRWANEASQCLGGGIGFAIGYPFFDSRVVDLAFSIDPYLKHKHGVEKYILRETYRGLLDETVIARRKVGIHEGTGCEDFLTDQVKTHAATQVRRTKDALCYLVLRKILVDEFDPADVNAHALIPDAQALVQMGPVCEAG